VKGGGLFPSWNPEEGNKQFQEHLDRGVFWKLTKEEMGMYKRPLNYITIVEASKNCPFRTTSLRKCVNSCMNQLPPPPG
jgi:hypothetical protein